PPRCRVRPLFPYTTLFRSNNGTFEYGQRGIYRGKERIRRALLLFGPNGLAPARLNNHMQLQNVIIVAPDGRSATGRWQGMVMLGDRKSTRLNSSHVKISYA